MFYPDMQLQPDTYNYIGYNYPGARSPNAMPSVSNQAVNSNDQRFNNGYNDITAPQGQPPLSPNPLMSNGNYNDTNQYMSQIPDSMPYNMMPNVGNNFNSAGVGSYAQGGMVTGGAEMSHVNPLEVALLEAIYGHSTSPETNLPQFKKGGVFGNPLKWIASNIGPVAGSVIGNMIAPGVGGIVGGSIGGAVGSAARDRDDYLQAGFRGAGIGALMPTITQGAGSLFNSLGAKDTGAALSKSGKASSLLPGLDKLLGFGGKAAATGGGTLNNASALSILNGGGRQNSQETMGMSAGDEEAPASKIPDANDDFLGSLMGNSKSFLSQPGNLLALASVLPQIFHRDKEKTPEQQAAEEKRRQFAMMLTPDELARKEANDLAVEQAKRRVSRNRFLPEERIGSVTPRYSKSNSPEEYAKSGRWVEAYDNPQYAGMPIPMKTGGVAYFDGMDGGQDDNRHTNIPVGTFIVDASTTSDLGDGNSDAGARNIGAMVSDKEVAILPEGVAAIGNGSHKKGVKKLEKMTKNVRKHKRGSEQLPPKAKSIKDYMR